MATNSTRGIVREVVLEGRNRHLPQNAGTGEPRGAQRQCATEELALFRSAYQPQELNVIRGGPGEGVGGFGFRELASG